ncbi:MAG: hypothetical protein Q4F11_06360 [Eubacteriales bacterium]|nr:hypothetical protein [Eubacteriales bacterium]
MQPYLFDGQCVEVVAFEDYSVDKIIEAIERFKVEPNTNSEKYTNSMLI